MSETLVNTTTAGHQTGPAAAGLSNGGYVVTWFSPNQDGSDYGIFAQRYEADGNAVGSETRVNTTTSHQHSATVASLPDGGYIVTWIGFAPDGPSIYAQRYDADGDAVGGATRVTSTTEHSGEPAVAAHSDGGYVVTWTSIRPDGRGIYAQRYDADGDAVGSVTRVTSTTEYYPGEPAVAALSDGGYVVTWIRPPEVFFGELKYPPFSIYAQRVDADGNAVGSEFRVGVQYNPAMAALPDGGYVVTWTRPSEVTPFTATAVSDSPEIAKWVEQIKQDISK